MAAEIKNKFGVEPELIKSRGGVFEIKKDGVLVFSKRKLGRFPDDAEALELLAK